jgi:transcriptional regulator NrdR family protein
MELAASHCTNCKTKMKAYDSKPHLHYGFSTIRRRRKCLTCDFRINTVELPESLADEIFQED